MNIDVKDTWGLLALSIESSDHDTLHDSAARFRALVAAGRHHIASVNYERREGGGVVSFVIEYDIPLRCPKCGDIDESPMFYDECAECFYNPPTEYVDCPHCGQQVENEDEHEEIYRGDRSRWTCYPRVNEDAIDDWKIRRRML